MLALLGAAVWADLQPIYWMLESHPLAAAERHAGAAAGDHRAAGAARSAAALIWLGQSRSFGSIQQALAPEKDTLLVDALAGPAAGSTAAPPSWPSAAAPASPPCSVA